MGIMHDDRRFVEERLSCIIYESRFMDIIEFQILFVLTQIEKQINL